MTTMWCTVRVMVFAAATSLLLSSCNLPTFPAKERHPDPDKAIKEFSHVMQDGPLKGKTVRCLEFEVSPIMVQCDYDHAF